MVSHEAAQRAALLLGPGGSVEGLPSAPEELRRWLAARIEQMLSTNPALLMSHLYRVDVREQDVQAALAAPDPAEALAHALIDREIEKAHYRRQYPTPDAPTL